MRTPNTKCCICGKPLYRRPGELKRVRHVACMAHRAEAQRREGQTDAQRAGLALGTQKGTNHRVGYKHKESSKRKTSESHKRWCAANPERVKARAAKTRGANHYKWKGGITQFNQAVRRLTENRKWSVAVRKRDGQCVLCGSREQLEADHIQALAKLIELYGITTLDEARKCEALWRVENGRTLCKTCHYQIHHRTINQERRDARKRKRLQKDAA